jgi:pimeloyl-ACP methyl ester carboxylesterase
MHIREDLHAETFGATGDPAIVLVHGAYGMMLHWDEAFCRRLADAGRYVVRCDLRGSGRFVVHEPFSMGDLVADAVGLLDGLTIEHAHFVGMSFGAGLAQLLALDHPDRVARLTLVSAVPGGPGHDQADLPGPSEGLFANEPPAPDWDERNAVMDYIVESERPYSPAFNEAAMRELAGRVFDHSTDLALSFSDAPAFDMGEPWRHRLGEIAAPTLVIHGADDPMFPVEHGRALAREIVGHEYPPPRTWDTVVPRIVR